MMLKEAASFVLASFKPSTLKIRFSEIGSTEGVFPFAKIYYKGERPTRSVVCTSSGFHLSRPCWTDFLSIPQGQFLLPVRWFFPQARIKTLQVLRAALGPVLDE